MAILIPVLIAALVYGFVYHVNHFELSMTLHGNSEVTLEYGEKFIDPGASAVFHGNLILKDGIDKDVKQMLGEIAEEYHFNILAMEVMPDHIHLLLDCRPQFMISDMVKIMKGNTARWLFLKRPELKQSLWGGHLWNPSYCAVTVSDRSREQVEHYIRNQKEK